MTFDIVTGKKGAGGDEEQRKVSVGKRGSR